VARHRPSPRLEVFSVERHADGEQAGLRDEERRRPARMMAPPVCC
jgi:hypothetical protein